MSSKDHGELMKLLTVIGARPQFIKSFPVSLYLETREEIENVTVHSGQHYDYELSRIFFEELSIPKPDYHLGVGSHDHGKQTAVILEKIEPILLSEAPDAVIVYGDTNSTLAGALAAVKHHIPVVHVEAGLRSYNRYMPEEINRVLTDHISTVLFCPTEKAVANLQKEGIGRSLEGKINGELSIDHATVVQVPDIMHEALTLAREKRPTDNHLNMAYALDPFEYVLATVHRAENTDDPKRMKRVVELLNRVSEMIPVVLPLHPRTRKRLSELQLETSERVQLINPVSYCQMLLLEENARFIMTDSGGIQKEAFWLDVPCFTLRTETEWVETVAAGKNHVVDLDVGKVLKILPTLQGPEKRKPVEMRSSAEKMVDTLYKMWKHRSNEHVV